MYPDSDDRDVLTALGVPAENRMAVDTPEDRDVPKATLQKFHQDLAVAFGVTRPSARDAKEAFARGVSIVSRLENTGQIKREVSRELIRLLAVLYLGVVFERLSEDVLGYHRAPPQPSFMAWLLDTER